MDDGRAGTAEGTIASRPGADGASGAPPFDAPPLEAAPAPDAGLRALCAIAGYYRVAADPSQLSRELALGARAARADDLVRAARLAGLKARAVRAGDARRLAGLPAPFVAALLDGGYAVVGGRRPDGALHVVDPVTREARALTPEALLAETGGHALLVTRRLGGEGVGPRAFSYRWFLPSIWRYRGPLGHVLLASLFVQLFALATPLFFQVVVDKVLVHRGLSTLIVLVVGLAAIGVFEALLTYLRSYALAHTTNRIDVELGQRLFAHLMRLPLGYFETRAAGQTVARVRELETIRSFLTGQALFSGLDLLFTIIFVAVLFAYSTKLALIVVASIPVYVLVAVVVRPPLRDLVQERFARGALSQQFLVEAVVGIHTIKAAAVEPTMRAAWEERLAAYVRTSFDATVLGAAASNVVSWISKVVTVLVLYFGALAVIDNELTVGGLVAFNMIAGQVSQPVLRLSQLWQDAQQAMVSVERLGDILNAAPEPAPRPGVVLPPPRGAIELRGVTFRYRPEMAPALRGVSLAVRAGEVVGIVGASGSGKSTLTKLIQRLYSPDEGQVLVDGADLAQVDPAWLRRHVGVVLQENLLFNRTIHDNIAFADPALPRARVIEAARMAGADEFVNRLPGGYDTMIEERGANLSGGQRQRLAIARALVTDPRILILDEATSALDYESERIVQSNMRRIVRGRTVVIVAHRLAAVRDADRIVGMHDGRVVEAGTHDELLARPNGLYARLWALQSDAGRGGGAAAPLAAPLPLAPPAQARA